ncbi:hypothetical protein ACLB2K_007020 [Fragaria x ananassa]
MKLRAHTKVLQEEVRILENLSHPKIVRCLGTEREDETLTMLLEYIPGGSIQSLLEKFGSFSLPVIKSFTKQEQIPLLVVKGALNYSRFWYIQTGSHFRCKAYEGYTILDGS